MGCLGQANPHLASKGHTWRDGEIEQESTLIGIDVSKAWIDAAVRSFGHGWSIDYNEFGVAELVAKLQPTKPASVLPEATGHIEIPLYSALTKPSLPMAVVNSRQVRDFPRSLPGW